MSVRNHRPERTCIGCMKRDAKAALIRIAVAGGVCVADVEGRLPGRGGYMHHRAVCLERFVRSKVREFRSLRRTLGFDERQRIADWFARLDSKSTVQ
jgi:predicted RNA-binding protein YlxR (DUF448 family)